MGAVPGAGDRGHHRGNLSTATAYIADISKPEERVKNFTLIGIAWSLGLISGPATGALFGQISLEAPAYVAAALSFLNVLLGIFLLPESLPKDRRETTPMHLRDFNPIVAIVEMARKPGLGWLLIVTCLFNFGFNGIASTSSLFMIDKFNAQSWQIGLMMALGGLPWRWCSSCLCSGWSGAQASGARHYQPGWAGRW